MEIISYFHKDLYLLITQADNYNYMETLRLLELCQFEFEFQFDYWIMSRVLWWFRLNSRCLSRPPELLILARGEFFGDKCGTSKGIALDL